MSLVLPTISGGTSGVSFSGEYGLSRATTFRTTVVQFVNSSEQRWQNRLPLEQFNLSYTQTNATDRAALDAFVLSAQSSALPWTFNLNAGGSQNFSFLNVFFDEDSFTWTENEQLPGYWDGTIRCRQATYGILPGGISAGAPFPMLGTTSPGYVTGFPFIRSTNYQVARVDLDDGNRISKALLYGSGMTQYPSRGLHSWTLTLSTLNNADLGVLNAHFLGMAGRYWTFHFTDPNDAKTYTSVRYDMDGFQVQYVSYGLASATVKLCEVFDSSWTA